MTGRPSAATQRGTVLAAVKATPCGWPPASLDPSCGRQPHNAVETRARRTSPRPRSVNLRSPRFRGMATLRRHIIAVPARLARPARTPVLHLPSHWPWAPGWLQLWDQTIGPSLPAAA